jgi:hypothetical protein
LVSCHLHTSRATNYELRMTNDQGQVTKDEGLNDQ